eukprot:TRINITY_DN21475_c0_g2_i2.p1 TRINITY_DN21475_c0_g2~~TRINITY_DN21475_c0_g2_i2.p1  ORF type:complete len:827 (+),score=147.38 TRINITY_DN21475_c0_g2_i2:79-2481(+)
MGSGASAEEKKAAERERRKREKKLERIKLRQEILESAEANEEYARKMRFLFQVPLLKRLPRDMQPLVASACKQVKFQPGQVIIKQGDIGNEFFVIQEGEALVKVNIPDGTQKVVAKLSAGDYFGEKALLASEPRTATIAAETYTECLKIHRKHFDELGLSDKLTFADRKAQESSLVSGRKRHEPSPKTEEDIAFIRASIQSNENLAGSNALTEAKVNALIERMWTINVLQGKRIIKEGDLGADHFYVIERGSFEVIVTEQLGDPNKPWQMEKGSKKVVDVLRRGNTFGELALLFLMPRKATIVCTEAASLWIIDRYQFKDIMMPSSEAKQKEYIKYFDAIPMLEPLLGSEKSVLSRVMVEIYLSKGEFIIRQNDPGNTFFMLIKGRVGIYKDNKLLVELEASHTKNQIPYFGERALLGSEKRAASVVVASDSAKCLMLDKESFDDLLGPVKEIVKNSMKPTSLEVSKKKPHHPGDASRDKIFQKDIVIIGRIGCGGYSKVDLVQHRPTGETYALKQLSKGFILKGQMQNAVHNERDILFMTNSPFITRLFEAYNSGLYLSFLLEPALGGDLYTVFRKRNLFGSTEHIQFYIASAAFGLEHMHERRILYRDMKPENMVVDYQGRMKLTDMGSSKFAMGKTYTVAGTIDYFAPETVKGTGHHVEVDWWGLGITLFELYSGWPCFESAFPMQTYTKIEKGIERVKFPSSMPVQAEDCIKALCEHEPERRIPMKDGGLKNLWSTKYFNRYPHQQVKAQSLPPPYVPTLASNKDMSCFFPSEEDQPRDAPYDDPGNGWDLFFASC